MKITPVESEIVDSSIVFIYNRQYLLQAHNIGSNSRQRQQRKALWCYI